MTAGCKHQLKAFLLFLCLEYWTAADSATIQYQLHSSTKALTNNLKEGGLLMLLATRCYKYRQKDFGKCRSEKI